jgi:hypothetical protein
MAKNNEVIAKVRVTIGGVEASKKNLEALKASANSLQSDIAKLNKQKLKFIDENNVKEADRVVKELNKLNAAWKAQQQMIKAQEAELNNYTNILDNLTNTRLTDLQKGLRDLQAQMKATLTMNDVKRYGELKAAYDQLLSSIEQLSGKVPNLSYVLKNVGQVADKTLSDSIGYMEKLIASTDKTTKRGRENIKQWTADLKTMREEMASRSIKVLENPQHYSVEAIQQAVSSLKKLQPTLRRSSAEWDNYSQKIKEAEQYLKSYDEKQKQLAEKAMRQQTDKVLANPAGFSQQEVEEAIKSAEKLQKTYTVGSPWWIHYKNGIDAAKLSLDSFNQKQKEADELARKKTTERVLSDPTATGVSEQAILDAIKHGKELQKQLEYGGDEWKDYAQKIKFAEDYLKSYDAEQRRLMETQKAQAAIQNAASAKTASGAFNLTKEEAKEAAEAIEKYINTLNMSTQADEIKAATDALHIYNEALGKVKETSVDVGAILKDPKNFSTAEIEQGIKQLEEMGKALKVGDTAAIQKNVDSVNKLKNALADSNFNQTWINKVVRDATKGKASIQDMEKAVALIKEKMKHTTKKTAMEKLRQDLDKLNPALDATKFNLERVQKTLGNIKGSNLGSLKEAAERLKAELNDVNLNMDDFADKAAKLKEVNQQIKELESQTKNVSSAWDNAVSRLKNWVLIYAGSAEVWNKMVGTYHDILKLSDAMADVRKTTGLTNDEIEKLSDQIQELDTRISNEKLMQAAVEAGRIGLKTRQEVFEFTRASAITLTALDELDARAITSVMKLNELLGETDRLGVQQAILSTASSINELSMASSAAQQPIIDFSRRFGGIAAQANISTAEVLGLGATIDALGQPIEMSSTALNKFTTALLSNGKAIAEDTGLSEDYIFEMTRQGKTIELMIEVLSKLNNMGGIGEISKYMGDMGGDGARMTAVISALAKNLGFLREQLDLSKMSFDEGISVINEYNIKNESAAALVERMANEIKENFVNSRWTAVITTIVKGLQELVHFMLSGTTAAKVFNSVIFLIIGRVANMSKAIKNFNLGMILFIQNMSKASTAASTLGGVLKGLWTGVVGLGKAIKSVFASNPFGWALVAVMWIADLIFASEELEEQTEKNKDAITRANEAFDEEAYKLAKLREKLDEAKGSTSKMQEVISTLNRDYGKQLGFVLDLAAGYDELRNAIDLAAESSRLQILQEQKSRNFQIVQEEFRERINSAVNELKDQIGLGEAGKGIFDFFSETAEKDLYAAIAADLSKSAALFGEAKVGKEVEKVLKREAEILASQMNTTADVLVQRWTAQVKGMSAVESLAAAYVEKQKKITELDEDVDREISTQKAVVMQTNQKQIDLAKARNELAKIDPKDYTAEDESTLESIISLYEAQLKLVDENVDYDKWKSISDEVTKYKNLQRDVLLAFTENPLRGVKMEVGKDGKLYKVVQENGKYQYEAVKEVTDANLVMLQQRFKEAGKVYDKLLADNNNRVDSAVMEQAKKLSDFRIAVKEIFKKKGQVIDEEGNLKLLDTKYEDKSSRQADTEAKAAYKALLQNMEEYYGKRKEIILARLLAEGKTIKEKNLEIKKWEVTYRQGLVDMQNELLGNGESFEENIFIRDIEQYKKAAALIQDASKTFRDQVANDMQKNRNKILDLQFLPATRGGGDAEKGIRKAYTAILKNIEEHYKKQKQIVEQDYLSSAITVEEKNRRIEELDLQHWQARIAMQREVLHEMDENGQEIDWFNENLYIRDLENFKFVKEHMLDESHHYQDTVRADMENTVYEQEKLLSKHKRIVDEILLGNDYQAQVDKEMQEAFEKADLFWAEGQERSARHAEAITAEIRKASADAYTADTEGLRIRLEENALFFDKMKEMSEEEYAAFLILLRQFHVKSIEADKKAADERKKVVERRLKDMGATQAYEATDKVISIREAEHEFKSSGDAYSSKQKEFEMEQQLVMQRIALDEWYYQIHYETLKNAGAKEEELNELQMEHMEKRNERQAQLLSNYANRLQEMADVTDSYGSMIGDGLAKMALGEEDAGKELLKNLLLETIQMGAEFAKRLVMEQAFGTALLGIRNTQYAQQATAAYGAAMTEVGIEASKMAAIEAIAAGEITAQSLKQPDSILTFGASGMGRAALLIGLVSTATAAAMAIVNSLFSGSTSKAESASSKRLVTGMLTYKSGRYPTMGDDGRTYSAQYEPTLRTGVYDGGNGKAHMALFSEVMPEMVVSGRTTRIIQEDFPGLMNAIMMIDKYGTLPQPRRVRRYAGGNVDEFDVEMVQSEDGTYTESPAITELRQSNQELREAVAQLTSVLAGGIQANINMYGAGGIKESMDKANKFYQKNRIK